MFADLITKGLEGEPTSGNPKKANKYRKFLT